MRHTLTWLHLSDFHFKAATDWRQDVVLSSLMRDVITKLPDMKLQPDMVAVTGDIANSGKDDEYRSARRFFTNVAKTFKHDPSECWFLVPGNHDVDRGKLSVRQKRSRKLFEDLETSNELLSEPETWADYACRQAAFFRFTDTFLGPDRAWTAKAPWSTDFFTKDNIQVGVLCLNSAWLAQDEKDKGQLLISEFQAHKALAEARETHLRFALFHHPLAWLRDFDEKAVRGVLSGADSCHILLSGHLHDTELAMHARPGFQTAELAAGACWQGAGWSHSVTVGQLDFTSRTLHLHVFTYSDKEGGFWTKDNQFSRAMPEGVWSRSFPNEWTFPSIQEAPKVKPVGPLVPGAYRKYLQALCGHIDALVEMDTPRPCKLRDIYVPLKTDWLEPRKKQKKERETVRRPLQDLVAHPTFRHFAVVGGPGAGKTTFMHHTALQALSQEPPVLPLLLSLKDFGAWLENHKGTDARLLPEWARQQLGQCGLKDLETRLERGPVLWLLDGLDEIFDGQRRLQAAAIIAAAIRDDQLGANRLLLTTRPHALDQTGIQKILALHKSTAGVLALDAGDQRDFLRGWFCALYPEEPEDAAQRRDDLWQKMERNNNLAELRGTPLLLSMIAAIYHLGKTLPERRADLYEKAIWNLLQRRYGPGAREKGSDRLVREMRRALMTTALWMMETGAVREIGEPDLIRELGKGGFAERSPDWSRWADMEEICVDLGAHSGLLTMKNNRFSFIHLGFQEYLAARAIAYEKQAEVYLAPHLLSGPWREVILLTVGALYESLSGRQGERLIRALIADQGKTACQSLALAVEAASQAPPGELGELEAELKNRAIRIIEETQSAYSEKDRFELGLALGYLGDPRLGLAKPENWISFETEDGKSFRLAKYLVTNADFKAFIQGGGYTRETFWDKQGLTWLKQTLPEPESRFPSEWWDKDWNAPNQPVVGVSWFEARAFCRWLTVELTRNGDCLPKGWQVRLPDNAEWGQVAGEGKQKYPWGEEESDETRACYNGRVGRTSPVGLYLDGSASEIHDLAGNVWEWNLDLHEKGVPFSRGGSWIDSARSLAASDRFWSRATLRVQDIGFRCCLAPEPS